jgi:DNA helicase IV
VSESIEAPLHPDHDAEQAYLDGARHALREMQERASAVLEFGQRRAEEEGSADAQVVLEHLRDRTASLELGDSTLAFGRIDEDPLLADGSSWYVGRRHIEDEANEPLVVDWRVPVAIPFYRATAADVQGLKLRRRFTLAGDELVAIFDEHLDDPESVIGAGLPDPLLAEIERARSGEMSDIVATIASEQDEIIRAPLAECLIVQGGPGTGKTAVGLHRAAFLLFEHRVELSTSQVLVVGPNRMFLRYVGNVLPSLGETAVAQATVRSMLDLKYRVRGEDTPEAHVLKGDLRMAALLRAAAHDKLRAPKEDERLGVGARTVTLSSGQITLAQKTALARNVPLNSARSIFSQLLVREAKRQLLDRGVDEVAVDSTIEELRKGDPLKRLVSRTWPNLGATTLVQSVMSNTALLKRVSASLLTDDERSVLHRKAAKNAKDELWTVADLALLDEAEALCVGLSKQYGHVVVDEAQDLSAMALRVVGRRARKGSITILGDIAQATAPSAQSNWDDVISALGVDTAQTSIHQTELTVGYRVPGPLLDFANRLLPFTAPEITPSTSVRHGGPGRAMISAPRAELASAVVHAVRDLGAEYQTTGVIVPRPLFEEIFDALVEADLEPVDTKRSEALGASLSVVDADVAKGLEFDAVVVVEPAAFPELHADELVGLRLLYVALTRAVQRLTIVHSQPLPAPLLDES